LLDLAGDDTLDQWTFTLGADNVFNPASSPPPSIEGFP
jgi:hypothetical protein